MAGMIQFLITFIGVWR